MEETKFNLEEIKPIFSFTESVDGILHVAGKCYGKDQYSTIPKKDLLEWLWHLKYGNYKQGVNRLQSEHGFCCLGVACDIFIPKEQQTLLYGRLDGGVPRQQPRSPKWLSRLVDVVRWEYGKNEISVMWFNDEFRFSFSQIAELLMRDFNISEEQLKLYGEVSEKFI